MLQFDIGFRQLDPVVIYFALQSSFLLREQPDVSLKFLFRFKALFFTLDVLGSEFVELCLGYEALLML